MPKSSLPVLYYVKLIMKHSTIWSETSPPGGGFLGSGHRNGPGDLPRPFQSQIPFPLGAPFPEAARRGLAGRLFYQ